MEAVVVTKHGSPDNLEIQEFPNPSPEPGEVCIRVSKAGINLEDILSRPRCVPQIGFWRKTLLKKHGCIKMLCFQTRT